MLGALRWGAFGLCRGDPWSLACTLQAESAAPFIAEPYLMAMCCSGLSGRLKLPVSLSGSCGPRGRGQALGAEVP